MTNNHKAEAAHAHLRRVERASLVAELVVALMVLAFGYLAVTAASHNEAFGMIVMTLIMLGFGVAIRGIHEGIINDARTDWLNIRIGADRK